MLQELLTAQETERRRLALEVHEQFGQLVSALHLGLSTFANGALGPEQSADVLARIQHIVARLDDGVNQLTLQLRPTSLDDLGLLLAVQQHVELWAAQSGVAAEFEAIGLDDTRLSPDVETVVYRVVEEALRNVRKHAHAQHVSLLLSLPDQQLQLVVEDDGDGFDVERLQEDADSRRQLGLLGMRERLVAIGGTMTIEAERGRGTTLYVTVPHALSPH